MITVTSVTVCSDCLMIAANGELGTYDPDGALAAEHIARMDDIANGVAYSGPFTDGDAEGFFSMSPCETCGETLAGTRYDATVVDH
jgi:hypothetical protein